MGIPFSVKQIYWGSFISVSETKLSTSCSTYVNCFIPSRLGWISTDLECRYRKSTLYGMLLCLFDAQELLDVSWLLFCKPC